MIGSFLIQTYKTYYFHQVAMAHIFSDQSPYLGECMSRYLTVRLTPQSTAGLLTAPTVECLPTAPTVECLLTARREYYSQNITSIFYEGHCFSTIVSWYTATVYDNFSLSIRPLCFHWEKYNLNRHNPV